MLTFSLGAAAADKPNMLVIWGDDVGVHNISAFFGNLYHLNAEEEPETYCYPEDPEFHKKYGPRGVIKATADGKIEDTGPMTRKRMETADEEFLAAGLDFIDRSHKANKSFFVWLNTTRMHVWTRLKKESQGVTGVGLYPDGMVEHDGHVGQLLKKLDDLGIADKYHRDLLDRQRQAVEGAPRWLQLPALLQGRGEERATRNDLLLRSGRRA